MKTINIFVYTIVKILLGNFDLLSKTPFYLCISPAQHLFIPYINTRATFLRGPIFMLNHN